MELFKYVTAERIDILQNGLIRFTQPKALNDPFDTQPSIDEIFSSTYLNKIFGKQIFPEELLKFFNVSAKTLPLQFFEENIGILSLAEKYNHMLMWSHYAEHHKGFIIHFNTDHEFFRKFLNPENNGNILKKVTYSKDRPKVVLDEIDFNDFLVRPEQLLSTDSLQDIPDLFSRSGGERFEKFIRMIDKIFYTKDEIWNYEQEWRLVRPLINYNQKIGNPNGDIYLYAVPLLCITGITLGCRMPIDRKREIYQLIKDNQTLSHIHLFEAYSDEKEFKLNTRSYSGS